jgi:hypothetical protein
MSAPTASLAAPKPSGEGGPARPSRREWLLVALACTWFWVAAWTAAKDLPAVADEIAHITGGESYWRWGVNHLQAENGYLAMHWATLPLRAHPPVFPPVPADLPQTASMIVIGNSLFYESGNDPALMLARGRAMMAVIGAALVGVIWWWSRRLWGAAGGLLSAGLAAFCPTLLANGALVMSDVTFSLLLLLTVTLWWNLLRELTPARMLACGVVLGALLLSKISGVLAGPMLVALALVRWLDPAPLAVRGRAPATGGRKFLLIAGAGAATALLAALVIWAAFGFRFSMHANPAAPQPLPEFTWEIFARDPGVMPRAVGAMVRLKLLPEAWLNGLAHTFHDFAGRPAFLNGRAYVGGSPAYFPYAWLVKTPLALFGLMALALAAGSARHRVPWRMAAPLLVLFVLYWAFALPSSVNIGHRHLMPIYATMLILAGGAAAWWPRKSVWWRGLVVALVAWFAVESLRARPRYLSYFNQVAGGPANGYRHLVDSNVDVGQDLGALQQWLAANAGDEPVFLTFFGPADPVAHGIKATRFSDNGFDARHRTLPAPVKGGIYCISVTLFQGMYTLAPGPWTAGLETSYRELLVLATSRAPTPTEALKLEQLQFARMRHVLAARAPDARVGDSILVFRLRDNEVAWMLYAPLAEIDRVARGAPPSP